MSPMVASVAVEMENLESLWDDRMEAAFDAYGAAAGPSASTPVALAATLVETALRVQELGSGRAGSVPLLLGDLCLARASRLLAEVGDVALQVAFAGVVQEVAAAAAGGQAPPPVRLRLLEAVRGC